ncbi:acyl-CoA carboxylase subunit beta [Pseudonocardia sp. ICBG1122]|nr:acyl-CoA carboxylase subunit beta [Pseudonocardia pini]
MFDRARWTPTTDGSDTGVVCGHGLVDGLPAHAYCSDPRVRGGAMSTSGSAAITAAIDAAVRSDSPVIGLWHSGGARIDQGVAALDGVGAVFSAMVRASGRVPQISVVTGPAAGGAAYGPALTDIVITTRDARLFVTGPDVTRQVTGEHVDMLGLGGPQVHGTLSGVAHLHADAPEDAIRYARAVATLLAGGHRGEGTETTGRIPSPNPAMRSLLPRRAARAYDVRPVVTALLDPGGIELQSRRAPNIVTVLGRLAGMPIGVLANNPLRMAGCLTAAASEKAARFVSTCDVFGLPLVALVDVPGYLPGVAEEHAGVLRHGAKLLHAIAAARTPRVTVLLRKAYGGAYPAMNPRSMGAGTVLAWPTAEVGVMGTEAAVDILHGRELRAVTDPEHRCALRRDLVAVRRAADSLDALLDDGVIDAVIDPAETAARVAAVLRAAPRVRSRHRNIPL